MRGYWIGLSLAGALGAALTASEAQAFFITGDAINGWNPGATPLTDNGDGTHSITLDLDAGSFHEFKITDGSWDNAWPGPNSWLIVPESGEITVTFTPGPVGDGWLTDENRIGLSHDPGNWAVVGSHQGWNQNDASMLMTALGGGLYQFEWTYAEPGDHEWKIVHLNSWNSISHDARSVATDNVVLTTTEADTPVIIYLDAHAGALRWEVVPEPASIAMLALGGVALLRRRV